VSALCPCPDCCEAPPLPTLADVGRVLAAAALVERLCGRNLWAEHDEPLPRESRGDYFTRELGCWEKASLPELRRDWAAAEALFTMAIGVTP
jgi:hypothetical protein